MGPFSASFSPDDELWFASYWPEHHDAEGRHLLGPSLPPLTELAQFCDRAREAAEGE